MNWFAFEFIFMLVVFGSIFAFCLGLLALLLCSLVRPGPGRDAGWRDIRQKPLGFLTAVALLLAMNLLFGSLTLSLMGLPTPIHFR